MGVCEALKGEGNKESIVVRGDVKHSHRLQGKLNTISNTKTQGNDPLKDDYDET